MKTDMQHMVHHGKEGWLFLDGGNNPFMAYLKGEVTLPQTTIQGWRTLLGERNRRMTEMGIQYCHVFAPEKASVYSEFVDENIDASRGIISVFSRHFPNLFVNVLPYFEKIKKDVQLFHKTDTHWNFSGCYACYQLICSQLKVAPNKSIASSPFQNANALLDLGVKTNPPTRERIKVRAIQQNYQRIFANCLIEYKEAQNIENEAGLHVGSHVILRNENAPINKKIIIFGDSFSEYRPALLTAMFAETFSEVHFIWSSSLDYGYIEKCKPDIVITEICERFSGVLPIDTFDVEKFAERRLLEFQNNKINESLRAIGHETQHKTKPEEMGLRARKNDMNYKLPDYLIIGSMKCGTTILNDFICLHPNVAPAKQKEIHYFSMYYNKGMEWYADYFIDAPKDKIIGEASPTYMAMSNNVVLPNLINTTLPNVKIIAILKDPVDRAISHFFHLRDINQLKAFQDLDPNKVLSGNLAEKYHNEFALDQALWPLRNVLEFGNYYFQLEAYRRIFGNRLLVLKNDDLWSNGQVVMDKVFAHLGLGAIQTSEFERKSYVTTEKAKVISDEVYASLQEYYMPDLSLMKKYFQVEFGDI